MKLSEEAAAFLNEKRFGVLATVNADGSPQQTVMWYLPQGDTIVMNTRKGRVKDRNLVRDGRASLCVEEAERYVTLKGVISVDDDAAHGQESVLAVASRYEGEAEAKRQVEEIFSKQHRITLTLHVDHVDVHGFEE
jgi:PPOX class probable F420-dependent enzyme